MGRVISTALRFIDGFTKPSADAIRSLQRMGNEFQKTGRQIQNAGKSISNIGSSITKAVTLPVTGIATAAVKTAADFESAMSEVGAISGASAKDMVKLTEKAKEMGATTAFSASESADAMKYMAMAGWKTKDMTEGIAGIMNLAAASGENLGTASDIVTDALTAFNMKASESSHFADVLATTSSSANTNVSMMGESFKYCASAAGAMGYKVEDISVALGVMANAGIKGSTAGTTLKNVIANMSKPTDTQAALMKKLGVSLTDGNGKTKDFASVMGNLRSSFSKLSETQKASAAATLAGKQSMAGLLTIVNASDKDFNKLTKAINNSSGPVKKIEKLKNIVAGLSKPTNAQASLMKKLGVSLVDSSGKTKGLASVTDNLRSSFSKLSETEKASAAATLAGKQNMAGLLAVVNASDKDFNKLTKAINNPISSAQKMADKMLDNLNGQITLLKSAIEGILITLGNKLLPHIKKVVTWVQKAADYINNLSDAQVNNIMKWAGIAAAIGPAVMVFGKVVTTVGTVTRTFGKVTSTIGNFGGILKTITSPAGIVISVLAGIALAAVLIIRNWSKVESFLSGVSKWFADAFKKAGLSVQDFRNSFSSIGNSISAISAKTGNIFKAIGSAFKKSFSSEISSGTKKADNALKIFVSGTISAFGGIVTAADRGLKAFSALLDFFTGAFAGNWHNSMMKFQHRLYNIFPPGIAAGLIKAFNTALPAIKAVVEGIKGMFGGLVQDIKVVFGDIKNVFKGFGTMFKGIFNGDAETALKGFRQAAGGILDTLRDLFKTKINAIKNFTVNALKNFLPEGVINTIASAFDAVADKWDNAVNIAKSCIDGFVQAVKPLLGNIKTVFKGVAQFVTGVFTGDWKQALNGLGNTTKGILGGLVNIIKAPFKIIGNVIKSAAGSFKGLNVVKTIFNSLGSVVKKVMAECGVDMKAFSKNISNIKTHASSILNNIKNVFSLVFGIIGKVVKTAAVVIAAVFGKKISSTCSTSKAALIAFKTVAVAAFKFLSNTIKTVMAFIVPVVSGAFGAIAGFISSAANTITSVISGMMKIFDGIIKFVTGVFTGNWKQAWQGVVDIFGGIFDTLAALVKAPINAVIGIINGAISGINKLGITIPDWVPKIGGQKFGINIPAIPMLYKGTKNWGGGAAVVHDRGGEIIDLPKGSRVYPHDKSIEMARHEGAKSGSITINIQKLADRIEVRSDEDIDRIAEALAYKLKRVAFNTGLA